MSKDTIKNVKIQPIEWQKIISTDDKNPTKWQINIQWTLIQRRYKKHSKHMNRSPASLMIREIQTTTTMRHHLLPTSMAITEATGSIKCWQGCGEAKTPEPWSILCRNLIWYSQPGEQFSSSQNVKHTVTIRPSNS